MTGVGVQIGIDLVEVDRIRRAIERWGDRFLSRVYADDEIRRSRKNPAAFAEHLAGRFAAKEATMKALGTGWRGLNFREIAVLPEPTGKPRLRLEGRALERSRQLSVQQTDVSITHTAGLAAAVVVMLCPDQRDLPTPKP